MKIEPLADRVVVEPVEKEEEKIGSIIIPDTAKESPIEGKVVAVGPGRTLESGKRLEMAVKPGDRVLYNKFAGTEVKIEGKELLIMRESDILAIIE
ncbi:co-chaperone GroES [Candidatus Poribacteria bacterium]|nr:co-chaperone GroES [Candidatus Poribacteria bacterium]HDO75884.1 co-chaperone GroES [Candidatus Poribacteria bacterium]HEX29489.1 co-chaperone GroES [Candidatus Poribacteria bacterium]